MRWYRAILAGFFTLVIAFSACADTNTKEVTLGTCVWPPYIMSEKSSSHGYAYDVVKKAFEIEGYHVTIKIMDWENARELAIDGKIDGLFPEYESKDNLNYFIYSNAFLADPLVLYTKKGNNLSIPDTNSQVDFFNQMKANRFGIVLGYTNVPAFDNNNTLIKKAVISDKANLKQLYQGKVDFILIDKLNAQYILAHELPEKYRDSLEQVGPELSKVRFYIVFSKKAPHTDELNNDFNAGLKKLQATHQVNIMMQPYIIEFLDKSAPFKK